MKHPKFYITSPIFYPNAKLHMGHAYTMTVCDVLARYHRLVGDTTYFLTGTDENTGKVIKSAEAEGVSVHEFLQGITANFQKLYTDLDFSYDQFIRTTDQVTHWPGAFAIWQKLVEAGDIYKGSYVGLYCPSCETFYTEKDLVEGKCPQHGTVPEKITEENYFFKLSKYTQPIKEKISSGELKIVPEARKNEIVALLERGLEDISFSRPIKNVPHGIPVPGDESQVIYVWCDALVNYISALGYGTSDDEKFTTLWPADVHVVGKDILRFHAAIWPAMLLSAGLPLPHTIFVHGLITSGGRKMSKSIGNVIDPEELITEYGKDAVRYYLAREISPFEDGDLTRENFKTVYNAQLANGIGNLVSRIMKMATAYEVAQPVLVSDKEILDRPEIMIGYHAHFKNLESNKAGEFIWQEITKLDQYIQKTEPFKLIKTNPDEAKKIITELVEGMWVISTLLIPFIPETAIKIKEAISEWKMPQPLFMRK